MRKAYDTELKVGLFVTIGLALVLISILVLGGSESLFTRKDRFVAHFSNVEGLIPGAKVVMGGLQVGTVESVKFDLERRDIKVMLQIKRDQAPWIRKDSTAEIATQGVLGDKYVILSRGNESEPQLPPGSEITERSSQGLTQFLSKGDQLLVSLQSIAGNMDKLLKSFQAKNRSEIFFDGMAKSAKNLASASEKLDHELESLHLSKAGKNINEILTKINNGTGTLGALVNDPGLYEDAKALMGGANRNRVVRNLVRQTVREGDEAEAAQQKKK